MSASKSWRFGSLLFGLGLACGAPAGTQPQAMSAAEHESAAREEARAAGMHQGDYNPAARAASKTCNDFRAERGFCWSSEENPTAEHQREAEHHRELAARHRAANEALRAAEAQRCAGVPEEDQDLSPFVHREEITSVSPLREEEREVYSGRARSERTAGAEITLRAVPGLTAEWLQRVVNCHIARNAAIGHETASAEMAFCPLTLRGVSAEVRSAGDGFVIAVRSDDTATVREILRRAEGLKGGAAH